MYKITHDADSIARQVVPQDFSFLSDADGQIVKALELIISRVFVIFLLQMLFNLCLKEVIKLLFALQALSQRLKCISLR